MDTFTGHKSEENEYLLNKWVETYMIPLGCTGLLEPFKVALNKPFEDLLRRHYMKWKDLERKNSQMKKTKLSE